MSPQKSSPLDYLGPASGVAFERWREEFCRRVMGVDFSPLGDTPLHRQVTPLVLPQLNLSASTGTPVRFTSLGQDDKLVLLLAPDSPLRVRMGKREFDAGSRALSLGDASLKGAYVDQITPGGFRTLLIDRAALVARAPQAMDQVAGDLSRDPALAEFVHTYYDLTLKHAPALDPLAQHAMAQHLFDLVVLLLGANRDETHHSRRNGLASARLDVLRADILRQLSDPALNIKDLARRHRVSARFVQALFQQHDDSFSRFVLEQRLLKAQRLLSDPTLRERKIIDIAHMSGFGDLSYFHRCFRGRFGLTPADARAAAAENPGAG